MCDPQRHSDLPCDRTGEKLAALLFGKPELYSKLESQYLICIQYIRHPEMSSVIRVQGEEQRVLQTVSQLHNMLKLIDPSPPPTLSPPPHLPPGDERDSVNAGLLRAMLSTVESRATVPPYQYPAHLLPRNSPEVPISRKKVDYYVQLGFQQEIVESTIASLGPGAHDNDIMHRLNMRGTRAQSKSAVILEPVTPGQATPPSCGVGEVRRVMDPSNLRPVVVDGSNVAMRYATVFCDATVAYNEGRGWLERKVASGARYQ